MKGERVHIIINAGGALRPLQSSDQDEASTKVLAQQLTVITRNGVRLEDWSVGLQVVMLEKIAGGCLVNKLRAIQLYEADFNCYNQFIFRKHAMQTLTQSKYIPEAPLMADLSHQARQPMIVGF
jgi:hypothetical protein